ncbi:MAG: hypothetical protein ACYSWZ_04710 [Planctomycetota bacterium]
MTDRSPQTPPGPWSPGYCVANSDYNPFANDPQHISTHQWSRTALYCPLVPCRPSPSESGRIIPVCSSRSVKY